jgi:hypothetical protein
MQALKNIDWDNVRGILGGLLFGAIILGWAWLVVMDYENGKAKCPGYYNVNYGCAVPR